MYEFNLENDELILLINSLRAYKTFYESLIQEEIEQGGSIDDCDFFVQKIIRIDEILDRFLLF